MTIVGDGCPIVDYHSWDKDVQEQGSNFRDFSTSACYHIIIPAVTYLVQTLCGAGVYQAGLGVSCGDPVTCNVKLELH